MNKYIKWLLIGLSFLIGIFIICYAVHYRVQAERYKIEARCNQQFGFRTMDAWIGTKIETQLYDATRNMSALE